MPVTPAWWRRLHVSTRIAAAIGGLGALLLAAPLAWAVLMARSPGSDRGASAGAWAVIGVFVLIQVSLATVMAGLIVAGIRRLWLRSRAP